jgi:hypothetical protein
LPFLTTLLRERSLLVGGFWVLRNHGQPKPLPRPSKALTIAVQLDSIIVECKMQI